VADGAARPTASVAMDRSQEMVPGMSVRRFRLDKWPADLGVVMGPSMIRSENRLLRGVC
jgi:hypothetical protein